MLTLHELAHASVALLAGIPVIRFSFGFGPGYTIQHVPLLGELHFGIIPLGAYVQIAESDVGKMSLGVIIMFCLAGVAANFCTALALSLRRNQNNARAVIDTCLQAIAGPEPIWDGDMPSLRWWEKWSLIGVWKIAADSDRTFREKLVWLSLILAQLNLIPIPILDGGKAVMIAVATLFPFISNFDFYIVIAVIILLYFKFMSVAGERLQKRIAARAELLAEKLDDLTMRINATKTATACVTSHGVQLNEAELENIVGIFYELEVDRKIADEANIPVVVAIANQRLNEYLRSIGKLPNINPPT